MVITIMRYNDDGIMMLGSKRTEFTKAWGSFIKTHEHNLFNEMTNISNWANNELKEPCFFDIV